MRLKSPHPPGPSSYPQQPLLRFFVENCFLLRFHIYSLLGPLGSRLPACPHWGQNQSTPPNGLFALKICRSNPKPGHEINPMALYAHYKAFCCVMISLARPAAYIIVPNPFFTSRGRENSFYWETRGAFFAAIVGEQIARLAREQQKWALSRHPWPCHFFLTLVSHLDCVHIKVLSLAAA